MTIQIINAVIMAIGIAFISNIIAFKNMDKKKLLYMSFGLFIIFINESSGIFYFSNLLAIILIGIFEYLDEGKFLKGLIIGSIGLIISMVTSSIVISFIDLKSIMNNKYIRLFTTFSIMIIAIAMTFILRKIYLLLKDYRVDNISWKVVSIILVLIVGILSAYISTIPIATIAGENDQFTIIYNGSSFSLYLILLLGMLYVLWKKLNDEIIYKQKLKESEYLKEYTDSLEEMSEDLRKFRHDYVNIISSMVGYIDDNDVEGLKDHIHNNIIPLERRINKDNTKIHLLKNIKIPQLKGLISSKIIRAQELNINVSIEIMDEIKDIKLDIINVCRIIGILLDNAIEECEIIEGSYLKFGILKNISSMDFIISNSCRENIEPIYKLNSKGFSTKGKNRGLGLAIVDELIEKNNNIVLDTIIENKVFTQILTIME